MAVQGLLLVINFFGVHDMAWVEEGRTVANIRYRAFPSPPQWSGEALYKSPLEGSRRPAPGATPKSTMSTKNIHITTDYSRRYVLSVYGVADIHSETI